jgi:hypothetical protein
LPIAYTGCGKSVTKRRKSFLQGLKPVESTPFTSALKHRPPEEALKQRPPEEKGFFRSVYVRLERVASAFSGEL